jgi:hypothetical protein
MKKKQNYRLIDATLISAMKSGSTYLSEICSQHPEIFMTKMNFGDQTIIIDLEKYKNEKLVMARRNMKPHELDAKIYYSHNPNMKFVMFIRNPILRAYSQFAHHVRKHLKLKKKINVHTEAIHKNIYNINKDALLRKDEYEKKEVGWIKKSEFYTCLSPYLKLFTRNNFFILPLELFSEDPENWLRKIFFFLGISDKENIKDLDKRINQGKYKANFFDRIIKPKTPEFVPLKDETKFFFAKLLMNDVYKTADLIDIDLVSLWKMDEYL